MVVDGLVFLTVRLVEGIRVARMLELNKVINDVATGLRSQRPTKMAAPNGGFTGVVTRWVVIEIAPALWPHLYCAFNVNHLRRQ